MEAENCLTACLWKALANMAVCGVSVSVLSVSENYGPVLPRPACPIQSLVNTVGEEMLSRVSLSLCAAAA